MRYKHIIQFSIKSNDIIFQNLMPSRVRQKHRKLNKYEYCVIQNRHV